MSRAALGVFAGLLLPVPLALLVVTALHGVRQTRSSANVSPVLSHEERLQRGMYLRHCEKSAECESPMGCLKNLRLKDSFCTDSDCVTDAQCKEGESCQWLRTEGNGPRVGVCVVQGMRGEGEACSSIPERRQEACASGLRCFEGWCGRPCQQEVAGSCPEGFFCGEDPVGPVCLPTCEVRGCPEGEQCVRFLNRRVKQPVTSCRRVYGSNCRQTPCPEGQKCIVNHVPDRPEEVWMACMKTCGKERLTCADGLVCVQSYCRQPCNLNVSGACGLGMRCMRNSPDEPAYCRPDFASMADREG